MVDIRKVAAELLEQHPATTRDELHALALKQTDSELMARAIVAEVFWLPIAGVGRSAPRDVSGADEQYAPVH